MLAANRRQALKPLLPRPVSVREHLPLPALLGLALCHALCLVWMLPALLTYQEELGRQVRRQHLKLWSPTFLVPWVDFVEEKFSMDWGGEGDGFGLIQEFFHLLCTLFLSCGNFRIFRLDFRARVHVPMRI